jgi:MazG family protein
MSDHPSPGVNEFARLLEVVRELRTKCPWDREQTVASLAKHLLEESYEAVDAIERGDAHVIMDELGDLLAQTLFITVIADEYARFSTAQMLQWAADKLVRRHPHVYGNVRAETVGDVLDNWSRMKAAERERAGASSALDGVVHGQPALMRAEKLGMRARQAGMDWGDIHAVLAKVREEMDEVEGALARNDTEAAAEELGDMLLALANAPRFIGHNAEETADAQIEALWQEAKRAGDSKKT